MRIVIIGNSAAAVGVVETIRHHDQFSEILVISEEPHLIYSRPMLSHFLAGEIDKTRLLYRGPDFYTKHSVQPVLNDRVVAIETGAHRVHTQSGRSFSYDKLVISTGGTPIVPPLQDRDTTGVFTFTRYAAALGILNHLATRTVRHAVVVGGGMIGLKAADALMKRGVKISIVELAPRILSAALDETGSRLMTNILQDEGAAVLTGDTITRIVKENDELVGVELKEGRPLACDMLVFGIGVRPNAGLAQEAGIQVNRGVVVDHYMCTSAPDVYAAGDVAEAYDLVVDMNRTVAIWPNAYRQGAIAGAHIVGAPRADEGGIAMNTVEAGGVPAISIGNGNVTDDGHEFLVDLDERKRQYRRLVLKNGRLVGAILVKNIRRAGIYTGLIRNKIDVSHCREQLMNDQISLLSLPEHYRKHVVTGQGIEV